MELRANKCNWHTPFFFLAVLGLHCYTWVFSSCDLQALQHKLSSCVPWAPLPLDTCNLPGPGNEPVSPELSGEFLSTIPPGKSLFLNINNNG